MSGKHEKRHQIFPDPRVDVKEWDVDGYPASIFVKMGDQTVKEFVRKIEQPAPVFRDKLDKFTRTCGGGHSPRTNEH